jgi:RNA polymerase sigma-70 factor (ECF subfamily)
VEAFLAAVRDGDFERLVSVLDPQVVLRADGGALAGASRFVRGAHAVAAQAATFSKLSLSNQVVLVNGNVGLISRRADCRPFAVLGFTISGGMIVEIDILADPGRLNRLDLGAARHNTGHTACASSVLPCEGDIGRSDRTVWSHPAED